MTWTEQVQRPRGPVYRARRSPRVEEFATADYSCGGFLVTRTHDIDVALALVTRPWTATFGDPLPAPRPRWVRLVPWDDHDGLDGSWIDVEPTEPGAIPAVEFRAQDW